jgi:hypothetical protein
MALFENETEFLSFSSALLLLLLNTHSALAQPLGAESEEDAIDFRDTSTSPSQASIVDVDSIAAVALYNLRLCSVFALLDEDLGFWVKSRSTTWFSRFLLSQYGEERWIQMFRMTKRAVFALSDVLKPHIEKQDTKYRLAIPVLVRLAVILFKLTHSASLFVCSEMFAVGKSTCSAIIRETVRAINDCLRHEINWPTGERLHQIQHEFQELCGLLAIVGAIDGMHISISKPRHGAQDYYYFKSGGYTLNCQAVVDNNKRFLDLYVGMPGSTNDARVLRRSSLYQLATSQNLFDARYAVDGFSPYLLGDSGCPLLPWLMVPHKNVRNLSVLETLFNRKLRKGRCVVENAFGILKQTFRELLMKSDLDVVFLPDVIICCAILHNVLLGQSPEEVEQFLQVLRREGLEGEVTDDELEPPGNNHGEPDNGPAVAGMELRTRLVVYLAARRQNGR